MIQLAILSSDDLFVHASLLHLIVDSACTSVILGGNEDLTEEESRLDFI